jgi:pimeloyl-ACP methyl ester carboxylesterase
VDERTTRLATVARAALTPVRYPERPSNVEWDARDTVAGADGRIATWSKGAGPAVLLVHGWEGRHGDLDAFVAPLVASGHRVVALDLPAHGETSGTSATLLDWARAIGEVAAALGLEPLAGIVAHSAGCPATALALQAGVRARRAVLIASPQRYEVFVRWFASEAGVEADDLIAALSDLGLDVRSLDVRNIVANSSVPALILHSADDRVVDVRGAEEIAAVWPGSRFERLDGLGHSRILRDPGVVERVLAFISTSRP